MKKLDLDKNFVEINNFLLEEECYNPDKQPFEEDINKEKSLDYHVNNNYNNYKRDHYLLGNLRSLYLTRNITNNMSNSWYNIKNNDIELDYANIYYKDDDNNEKMY